VRTRWHTQFEVLDGSSAFHKAVGRILAEDPLFRNTRCYQEVPLPDLIEGYPHPHRLDWYLSDFGVALELHGAQHYEVVNFGGVSVRTAREHFRESQYRDNLKRTALEQAGFAYREVHYRLAKRLTSELLKQIVFSEE